MEQKQRTLVRLVVILGALTVPAGGALASGLPPGTLSFHSAPGLHPPAVGATADPDGRSGDIFLTPAHSYQEGPMILNPNGHLIWFQPIAGWTANLELQHYKGRPVLTWWQGRTPTSDPEDVIVDASYRTVAIIHGSKGYLPDLHEFQITPQGTALINTIDTVSNVDLSAVGGSATGSVSNDIVEEVAIPTGRVLWRWGSLSHVPVTASYQRTPKSGPYDYFHLNSIQQLPGGDLLLSARNTSAVYLINKGSGAVIWTLGGKRSNFRLGPGAGFQWQHDAHLTGPTLTLFNDAWGGAGYPQGPQSTALKLHLNTSAMTATLVHSYSHSPTLTTGTQGSMETLPNGDVFVGWGADPDFSEYSPGGSQIFNGNFALGVKSYRAYRFPWAAQPVSHPSLAVSAASGGRITLYASWNGATRVFAWRVLGGATPKPLVPVARKGKHGFETPIKLKSSYHYFEVQALDSKGDVLGTSAVRPR